MLLARPCPDAIYTIEAKVIFPEAQTGSSRHNSRIIALHLISGGGRDTVQEVRVSSTLKRLRQDFTPAELLIVADINGPADAGEARPGISDRGAHSPRLMWYWKDVSRYIAAVASAGR